MKGFTLIELIIVIVIIGILAAIAIPKYINLQDSANHAARDGTAGAARAAVLLYYSQTAVTGVPTWPAVADVTSGALMADGQAPIMTFGTYTWAYDGAGSVTTN